MGVNSSNATETTCQLIANNNYIGVLPHDHINQPEKKY